MIDVIEASTDEQYRAARSLIEEYVRFIGVDLEFQGFSKELADLAEMYGPPKGAMILLRHESIFVGCVGLRPLPDGSGEMKRLYVQPAHQGKGLGRLLLESFITKARELGYKSVRLDTVPALSHALALYRKYGFYEIGPYRHNPAPDAIFLELKL